MAVSAVGLVLHNQAIALTGIALIIVCGVITMIADHGRSCRKAQTEQKALWVIAQSVMSDGTEEERAGLMREIAKYNTSVLRHQAALHSPFTSWFVNTKWEELTLLGIKGDHSDGL
jgi:hypothetical protein